MDNAETQATLGRRHKANINKTIVQNRKLKLKMNNTEPTTIDIKTY
jgi:hypothetical protein